MSKILSISLITMLLAVTSCGGGWSEDQKTQIKNQCLGNGSFDCECFVESVVKAHPNPDDYNALTQEEKDALVVECEVEEELTEENLESF